MSSMREGRFFRNPDFQLRDLGTSAPDVSFSENVSPSRSTHPVTVTFGTRDDCAVTGVLADSIGGGSVDVLLAAGVLETAGVTGEATGFLVSTRGVPGALASAVSAARGASVPATSAPGDGWPAVISATAPTTQIAPTTTAGRLNAQRGRVACFAPAALFDWIDRAGRFALFFSSAILLSESFWSFRSALSKYRIDRFGVVPFFARTSILLRKVPGALRKVPGAVSPPPSKCGARARLAMAFCKALRTQALAP
jgi:hypothetical protein